MRERERESYSKSHSQGLFHKAGELSRTEAEFLAKMNSASNETNRELRKKLAQRFGYQVL
jgi:hypothetical protein